jgi:hypothetical protein
MCPERNNAEEFSLDFLHQLAGGVCVACTFPSDGKD